MTYGRLLFIVLVSVPHSTSRHPPNLFLLSFCPLILHFAPSSPPIPPHPPSSPLFSHPPFCPLIPHPPFCPLILQSIIKLIFERKSCVFKLYCASLQVRSVSMNSHLTASCPPWDSGSVTVMRPHPLPLPLHHCLHGGPWPRRSRRSASHPGAYPGQQITGFLSKGMRVEGLIQVKGMQICSMIT